MPSSIRGKDSAAITDSGGYWPAVAETIIEALRRHEVDAVVGKGKIAFLLLSEVENALVKSEAEFRAMFELSGIGMIRATAPALRITRVNPRFCEMTGYSAEE